MTTAMYAETERVQNSCGFHRKAEVTQYIKLQSLGPNSEQLRFGATDRQSEYLALHIFIIQLSI
jgi:hypothetical protein